MSEQAVQLTYDGPALTGHTMNVEQLAPAMLAMATVCQEATALVNQDKTSVNVFVKSDFEHGCFEINFEVVQTVLDAVAPLIQDPRVATAKEILEWLGFLVGPPAASIGLIAYLRKRRARNVQSAQPADQNNVEVRFEGDSNTVIINNHVYQMSDNAKIVNGIKQIVRPTELEGIDSVEFSESADSKEREVVSKKDARYILDTELPEEGIEPQIIEARLRIYSPVFDSAAGKWRFRFGRQTITADISETSMAENVLARGRINVGDSWKVQLEITERKTPTGNFVNDYKILRVLDFNEGAEQGRLPLDPPEGTEEGD